MDFVQYIMAGYDKDLEEENIVLRQKVCDLQQEIERLQPFEEFKNKYHAVHDGWGLAPSEESINALIKVDKLQAKLDASHAYYDELRDNYQNLKRYISVLEKQKLCSYKKAINDEGLWQVFKNLMKALVIRKVL